MTMRARLKMALACLGLTCIAPCAVGQEHDLADRLVAGYAKLGSYCARAQKFVNASRSAESTLEMELCVVRDGRFRSVVTGEGRVEVLWSDGESDHRHHHYLGPRPSDSYGRVPAANRRAPDVPPILMRTLYWYELRVADMAGLRGLFEEFESKPELSTAALAVYEVPPTGRRVWIGREDGLIRRVGSRNPGFGEIVLTDMQLDPVLSPEALRHEAPAAARFFGAPENLIAAALAVSALSFALGFAYGQLRRRAAGDEATDSARAWRSYRSFMVITAPLAILLGLFAPKKGDGMAAMSSLIEHLLVALAWLYLLWLGSAFLLGRSASARLAGTPKRG